MEKSSTHIEVIMAIYRPRLPALERQILSVLSQDNCDIRLTLFADGPMEEIPEIEKLISKWGNVVLVAFPDNRGAAATFLEGLAYRLEAVGRSERQERFFAFCDQDDRWSQHKLARSLELLNADNYAAIHSDAQVVDDQFSTIAPSLVRLEQRNFSPSLTELFFQNNATGMTMVLTQQLAGEISQLRHLRPESWLHDHFCAFLAAAGQGLGFLDMPLVEYVQHGQNVVGAAAPASSFTAPSGQFRDNDGKSARYLRQGEALLAALLGEGEHQISRTRSINKELDKLHSLLRKRGVFALLGCLKLLMLHRLGPRSLYARLFWSKIFK